MPSQGPPAATHDSTSSSLLQRACDRDPQAWERLAALYGPLVYRWSRHFGLQAADAADVVQEIFRSVAANLAGFQKERPGDSFRGWLRTIARNKVRDHYRSEYPDELFVINDHGNHYNWEPNVDMTLAAFIALLGSVEGAFQKIS